MQLTVMRRAETEAEAVLSARGVSQLEHTVDVLRSDRPEVIVSSEMPRALVSAQRLADDLQLPLLRQADLRERDFGDWNTWEWPAIATELDRLSVDDRYVFVPPGGESWQQLLTSQPRESTLQLKVANGELMSFELAR
jgi:broad specificity phosphatase PhoE